MQFTDRSSWQNERLAAGYYSSRTDAADFSEDESERKAYGSALYAAADRRQKSSLRGACWRVISSSAWSAVRLLQTASSQERLTMLHAPVEIVPVFSIYFRYCTERTVGAVVELFLAEAWLFGGSSS